MSSADIDQFCKLLNNVLTELETNQIGNLSRIVELELNFKKAISRIDQIKAKFVPEQEIGVCEVNNLILYRENPIITPENIPKAKKTEPADKIKNCANVQIDELKTNIKIETVENLREIPNAFYWFAGNNKHRAGMYCRIHDNFIRVPFPNIIDSFETRDKTISCKNITRKNCDMWRGRFDRKHDAAKSPAGKLDCMFAHETEKINKIGIQARCPSAPQFGNPQTFNEDIEKINKLDLVRILLYSVNDLGLAYIYMQNKGLKGKTIDNLEYIINL